MHHCFSLLPSWPSKGALSDAYLWTKSRITKMGILKSLHALYGIRSMTTNSGLGSLTASADPAKLAFTSRAFCFVELRSLLSLTDILFPLKEYSNIFQPNLYLLYLYYMCRNNIQELQHISQYWEFQLWSKVVKSNKLWLLTLSRRFCRNYVTYTCNTLS